MDIKLLSDDSFLIKGKDNELTLVGGKIKTAELTLVGPGEYEVGGVQILGVRASNGKTNWKIKIDGMSLAIVEAQNARDEEELTGADILLSRFAGDLLIKLEPKIIIAWGENSEKILKEIGKEDVSPVSKFSIKKDKLPLELEAVWLK